MRVIAAAVVVALLSVSGACADSCASKAIDKNGKPLAGAAKTSSVDKCEKDLRAGCEAKALDKNGKPLAGAAKASNVAKCVKDADV